MRAEPLAVLLPVSPAKKKEERRQGRIAESGSRAHGKESLKSEPRVYDRSAEEHIETVVVSDESFWKRLSREGLET
ncbi:hypothetical protein NDU88_010121 [Pleurodeles waltl]|uniref:Brachyury n=1 Tax=Pleurodeles waltl TaxID=8319 RepID=A0AAV7QTH5_PLEWA|nr:hypothetical protein NDU88_010121 [Pleurodeles waltl]